MKSKESTQASRGTQFGFPAKRHRFASFDGGVSAKGLLQQPDRYRFWAPGKTSDLPMVSRGAGLSYSAASFSNGGYSVEHTQFNRILDFDSSKNIVEVEAGVNLATLYAFLSNRGLFLPTQPGHGRITVGGCVAADVHGKNHIKDGTFINQVVGLDLFHPDHGILTISPETGTDLFRLTCGGYGLTGSILRVKLQASKIKSQTLELRVKPVDNVMSGIERLIKDAVSADLAYSWHDFNGRGDHFGRGFVYLAEFNSEGDDHLPSRNFPGSSPPFLSADERKNWRFSFLNRQTARMLNLAYRIKQDAQGRVRNVDLWDAIFPIHDTQFYFKLFGNRGFHEYQVVIPKEHIHEYLAGVQEYVSSNRIAVTLASAKLFGGYRELLRFTGDGICFAINFPRTSESPRFLVFLDELVISLGGIPNIIKDSRLPRTVVDACYPEAQKFRDSLRAFDPRGSFRSELSERLDL